MTGLNKFSDKQKREMRRRNHITRDLHSPKYRQRIEKRRKDNEMGVPNEELE